MGALLYNNYPISTSAPVSSASNLRFYGNCHSQGHYWDRATTPWQHDSKSPAHKEKVDGSKPSTSRGEEIIYYCQGALEISSIKFHRPGRDSNPDRRSEQPMS